MIALMAGTVVMALLVGSRANARAFIAATAATLAATVLLLYPYHDGLGLIVRAALNVTVFEITAISTMLFLAPARGQLARRSQGAEDQTSTASDT